MGRFKAVIVLALIASQSATAAESASSSLVTFRTGKVLGAFERDFKPDAREISDPDAWGYLTKDVKGAIHALEASYGFRATHGYSKVLRGFAADLTEEQIEGLRFEPFVESITVTVSVSSTEQHVPWGVVRIGVDPAAAGGATTAGEDTVPTSVPGVTVYVIDSGIDGSGRDLNLVKHVSFAGGTNTDCNGHGTHVSGTIGARDNDIGVRGVAPGVALVGVKVVDCSGMGSSATIIKGIDWVVATAARPSVVNLSLGGGASPALDAAVQTAAAAGIFFSIAAGNSATDACLASPSLNGASSGIMTVGAVDSNEREAGFSNFGGCVDLWAPGVGIASTARGKPSASITLSGTSMAAPHVAGAAALYLSKNLKATPSEIESALIGSSVIPGTGSKDGRTILRLQIGG